LSACALTLLLGLPPAAAGPDAVGGAGSDPSEPATFQRGEAVSLKSEPETGAGFVIFPIPISNPTIGTGLGLATGVLYQMDAESQPSYTGVGALATSNRTWGVGALQYLSLDEDRYRLFFGLGYASVHYDFFGTGSAAGDRGNAIPIRQNGYFTNPWAEVRVAEDLYVGLQYRLIEARTQIDAADRGGTVARLLEGRELDFVSSGFGPVLDWDTRDDPFWPREGNLLHFEAVFASGTFFSDFDYRKAHLSYNWFHEVFDDGVLALRASGCFTGGEVPVVDLCLFGAKNDLRGYETGRYRDDNSLALQAEQRWKFADRWGLVGFAGVGGVGENIGDALGEEPLVSGGLGLRFQASEDYNVNLAIDGAVNLDGDTSLYFRIGEAF
jgi:outer membrane protein assembly factor BamA